ncbi:MAG TPA: energy-coupling factor transporter ATPase [Actinobacteria bacterium]|nr:energy-coupling factor transporter ATPase [Actinomycetota bacterium]
MLIELKNVSFTYMPDTPLAQQAIKNVGFSVRTGEFVGLVGPTGSGKSTLIQHFNGLLEPLAGEVLIDGRRIGSEISALLVRQKIGVVFQFPENQLFEDTVFKDVAFGPCNLKCSDEEIEERVRSALKMVGLDYFEFKDRSPFTLSGGEMRRVAIAGVLAMNPSCLVLDEPTSGLDSIGKREILTHLERLNKEHGLTIILISHDMNEIARMVDRVVVLNEGKIEFDGSPKEVFLKRDDLLKMGLDVPEYASLLIKLNERGFDVPLDLFELNEVKDSIVCALERRSR